MTAEHMATVNNAAGSLARSPAQLFAGDATGELTKISGCDFTWKCHELSQHMLQQKVLSPIFSVGGHDWRLHMRPQYKGHMALYLELVSTQRVHAAFTLFIVRQHSVGFVKSTQRGFAGKGDKWGHSRAVRESDVCDLKQGWLADDTVEMKIHFKTIDGKAVEAVPYVDPMTKYDNLLSSMELYKLTSSDGSLHMGWQSGVLRSVSELLSAVGELEARRQMGTRYRDHYSLNALEFAVHYQELYGAVQHRAGYSAVRQILTNQFELQLSITQPVKGIEDCSKGQHKVISPLESGSTMAGKYTQEYNQRQLCNGSATTGRSHLSLLHPWAEDSTAVPVMVNKPAIDDDADKQGAPPEAVQLDMGERKEYSCLDSYIIEAPELLAHVAATEEEQQLMHQMAALSIREADVVQTEDSPKDDAASISSDDWEKVDAVK